MWLPSQSVAGVKGKAINFQTIVGALASGKQLKGVQAQFASMDVPVMGPDAFSDAMGKITVACKNLARKAFKAARQEEICRVLLSCEPVQTIDSEGVVHNWYPLKGSFDGAWCKRGTRQMGYNSLGGMAGIIGEEKGWVLDCEVLIAYCGVCSRRRAAGEKIPEHNCYKNYVGSAKAMEAEGAVRMAKRALLDEVVYVELTTDADSSTWAKLKEDLPQEVFEIMSRQLDTNHLRGGFYDKLLKLKVSDFKSAACRGILSNPQIDAWCHYLANGIKSNRGNKEAIKENLTALPYHLFGDHSRCKQKSSVDDDEGWCKDHLEPNHIPNVLKGHGGYMKDINGYQAKMIDRIEYYCADEMFDQIYKGSSDNRNESLHSTFTSISPKRAFYLRSGTYRAQVLAGCLQKVGKSLF
jgi:hypothetical protein